MEPLSTALAAYKAWPSLHTWRPLQDAIGAAFRAGYLTHGEALDLATRHYWA